MESFIFSVRRRRVRHTLRGLSLTLAVVATCVVAIPAVAAPRVDGAHLATAVAPLSSIKVPAPGNLRLDLVQLDDATCEYNVHGIYECSAHFEGRGLMSGWATSNQYKHT